MSPFDFVNAINTSKENLFETDPQAGKDYDAFIVNRGLSYFPDTVFYANQMNQHAGLDKDMQFFFFLNIISKKKRFSKWSKKDPASEDLKLVKEYYGYSSEKATEALKILSKDNLIMIKEKLHKGGKS
jgi:NACalpha-BTF3-like transcription factor